MSVSDDDFGPATPREDTAATPVQREVDVLPIPGLDVADSDGDSSSCDRTPRNVRLPVPAAGASTPGDCRLATRPGSTLVSPSAAAGSPTGRLAAASSYFFSPTSAGRDETVNFFVPEGENFCPPELIGSAAPSAAAAPLGHIVDMPAVFQQHPVDGDVSTMHHDDGTIGGVSTTLMHEHVIPPLAAMALNDTSMQDHHPGLVSPHAANSFMDNDGHQPVHPPNMVLSTSHPPHMTPGMATPLDHHHLAHLAHVGAGQLIGPPQLPPLFNADGGVPPSARDAGRELNSGRRNTAREARYSARDRHSNDSYRDTDSRGSGSIQQLSTGRRLPQSVRGCQTSKELTAMRTHELLDVPIDLLRWTLLAYLPPTTMLHVRGVCKVFNHIITASCVAWYRRVPNAVFLSHFMRKLDAENNTTIGPFAAPSDRLAVAPPQEERFAGMGDMRLPNHTVNLGGDSTPVVPQLDVAMNRDEHPAYNDDLSVCHTFDGLLQQQMAYFNASHMANGVCVREKEYWIATTCTRGCCYKQWVCHGAMQQRESLYDAKIREHLHLAGGICRALAFPVSEYPMLVVLLIMIITVLLLLFAVFAYVGGLSPPLVFVPLWCFFTLFYMLLYVFFSASSIEPMVLSTLSCVGATLSAVLVYFYRVVSPATAMSWISSSTPLLLCLSCSATYAALVYHRFARNLHLVRTVRVLSLLIVALPVLLLIAVVLTALEQDGMAVYAFHRTPAAAPVTTSGSRARAAPANHFTDTYCDGMIHLSGVPFLLGCGILVVNIAFAVRTLGLSNIWRRFPHAAVALGGYVFTFGLGIVTAALAVIFQAACIHPAVVMSFAAVTLVSLAISGVVSLIGAVKGHDTVMLPFRDFPDAFVVWDCAEIRLDTTTFYGLLFPVPDVTAQPEA